MPASEPSSREGSTRPAEDLGYDALAHALSEIRGALDDYLATTADADAALEGETASAQQVYERRQREADEKRAHTIEQVEHKEREARDEADRKHAERTEHAASERRGAERTARAEHDDRAGRAKREREESVWLADTVLESSLRSIEHEAAKVQGMLDERLATIESLRAALSQAAERETLAANDPPSPEAPPNPSFEELDAAIDRARDACSKVRAPGILDMFRGRGKREALIRDAVERLADAAAYAETLAKHADLDQETQKQESREKHRAEIERAEHTLRVVSNDSEKKVGKKIREAYERHEQLVKDARERFDADTEKIDAWAADHRDRAESRHEQAIDEARRDRDERMHAAQTEHDRVRRDARDALAARTRDAMETCERITDHAARVNPPWETLPETEQPTGVPWTVRFGSGTLDLSDRLSKLDAGVRDELGIPGALNPPIVMSLPGDRPLVIRHDNASRERALEILRVLMLRALASFPGGKARFVIADPVSIGQSFAGFMRLSDQEPSPVGQRIWSEPAQIERQLADVTEHMQTVIQKYLRADFETIERYNEAAGEIAEPYRFVVIADTHEALTDTGAARLKSILESGPRCGVYALLSTRVDAPLPGGLDDVIAKGAIELDLADGAAGLRDPRFDETAIEPDTEPGDTLAAKILDRVARAGVDAGRVEVPFTRLAPPENEHWSRACDDELVVPLGRSGARKIQEMRLGSGTRQHALIAGRTGSGKSTLLHVMITAAALWHAPDELEMYLIDFKKGVEFKAYTGGRVPHVRAVAIESDREFGLSVLERLDALLTERGERFRELGAQNLAAARAAAPAEPFPRILLLIDEFQEFFTEDDDIASEASLLLDRLVRQGRAFGIHVVLGSQTLAGAYSLARSTLGQIGVRIAMQCSEADSYLILGEDNNAARLLSRPGEAIYNNAGGLVEGNSPFQTAWLPDAERDALLDALPEPERERPAPVVFEGNKPADLAVSARALRHAFPSFKAPRALLGDAVAIGPPTSASLQRRSGANLVIVGPNQEPALGMLLGSVVSVGAMRGATVHVIDPTPEDDPDAGRVAAALGSTDLDARVVASRDAESVVTELATLVTQREDHGGEPVLLAIGGLHRLRTLRKSEDYSFSLDDDANASPDKQLAHILREGPPVGVFTVAWCDTLANLERALDRSSIREFGYRALMQMGASDSTMLMDSSAASRLGPNRAILADDVGGTREKFRPLDIPDPETAARAAAALRA